MCCTALFPSIRAEKGKEKQKEKCSRQRIRRTIYSLRSFPTPLNGVLAVRVIVDGWFCFTAVSLYDPWLCIVFSV